ncbi:MAG: hypothetical protein WA921_12075 [Ahrensia sp.]
MAADVIYKAAMSAPKKSDPAREKRLQQQLRANLQRRKQQARARREGDGDQRDEGIAASAADEPAKTTE